MTTCIALLRAVNLGPHNKVGMASLREIVEALGLRDVRTLLQTGNLVFGCEKTTATDLEGLLEDAAVRRLSLRTDVFVRTAREWKRLIAGNPFPAEARGDPAHLLVMFLKDAPGRAHVASLRDAIRGPEVVEASGRHLYAVYPDGIGRSRLTPAFIERKLGTRGTGRNWNTILKLDQLAES